LMMRKTCPWTVVSLTPMLMDSATAVEEDSLFPGEESALISCAASIERRDRRGTNRFFPETRKEVLSANATMPMRVGRDVSSVNIGLCYGPAKSSVKGQMGKPGYTLALVGPPLNLTKFASRGVFATHNSAEKPVKNRFPTQQIAA